MTSDAELNWPVAESFGLWTVVSPTLASRRKFSEEQNERVVWSPQRSFWYGRFWCCLCSVDLHFRRVPYRGISSWRSRLMIQLFKFPSHQTLSGQQNHFCTGAHVQSTTTIIIIALGSIYSCGGGSGREGMMCDKGCREEEVADVTTYNVHTDTDVAKHDQVCNDEDASQMSIGWSFRCYLVCWWCVAWAGQPPEDLIWCYIHYTANYWTMLFLVALCWDNLLDEGSEASLRFLIWLGK